MCGELAPIGPTGEKITAGPMGDRGSASWKVVLAHPDERETIAGSIVVEVRCLGTGRRV